MAESREMELLLEIGRLKNEYKELRLHLKQNKEQLSIMQVLPVDDRRAQNASTRTALRLELDKFTRAFARHLLPRLREQRVYEPAAWRASMQHLRMLATTDTSGMEDVAIATSEMFDASFVLTYQPSEDRDEDPFGFEFAMEFHGNTVFHAAWTALLTAVARHTQVLLKLYEPTSVEDSFLRHFEMVRAQFERTASELDVQIAECKEKIVRETGKLAHSDPVQLGLVTRASMRECLRRL